MADAVCRRCGLCCLRGGPTLMVEDAPLLREGRLALEDLVCLRAGEWARDDTAGELRPLQGPLLKLARWNPRGASAVHPWRCPFLQESAPAAACGIYRHRPVQCGLLFCGDTALLEKRLAEGGMLDRAAALAALPEDILPPSACALWLELIAAHEDQCPAGECLRLAAELGFRPRGTGAEPIRNSPDALSVRDRLTALARADAAFRELCQSRARIPEAVLPFLLGRPVSALLAEVGCLPG
ncbi:MAG: YkgJ family cysteine cluster protein [Desulfovibrionaceae bacterium]|nr:YkgJ family cysteine cluster protein [Desulfovibrionaceae bacterium]